MEKTGEGKTKVGGRGQGPGDGPAVLVSHPGHSWDSSATPCPNRDGPPSLLPHLSLPLLLALILLFSLSLSLSPPFFVSVFVTISLSVSRPFSGLSLHLLLSLILCLSPISMSFCMFCYFHVSLCCFSQVLWLWSLFCYFALPPLFCLSLSRSVFLPLTTSGPPILCTCDLLCSVTRPGWQLLEAGQHSHSPLFG